MVKTNSEVRQYRIRDYGTIPVPEIAASDIENFRHFANRSIQDLCNKKNSSLLIFPDVVHLLKNGIGEQSVCTLDDTQLQAGDLMGFIGRGNSQLTISSRFAAADQEDYFLHYMVQQVFDINLFDLKHASSQNQIFDFLTLLFPYYLKRALKQGIYKKYKTIAHNDANVKGVIDISKQIRLNTPFTGRIAYSVKEFSYDNELTQLIRHTIECIRTTPQASVPSGDLHELLPDFRPGIRREPEFAVSVINLNVAVYPDDCVFHSSRSFLGLTSVYTAICPVKRSYSSH